MADEMNDAVDSQIVTAVGVSVNSVLFPEQAKRLEQAMSDAILECTAEGLSTEEKNAPVIRARMAAAHQRALDEIAAEGKL